MARNKNFSSVEVIDKSIDVFLAKGFEATAIKDLVKATNVHPGSLYNAFGNKKKIFIEALERFINVSQFNISRC
jgi:TetR/AcrR family transcriptional repressor of nem operon